VLRPAVNTHHPEEARNKAKTRATLSPVKTAAVVGVGVVGLMGLHQVWGKVHGFLFGEPVPAKPASITPPLAPAVDVPEPPPVPKVKPQTKSVPTAFQNLVTAGKEMEGAVLTPIGNGVDAVLRSLGNTMAPESKIDPKIGTFIAEVLQTDKGKGLFGIFSVLFVAFADKIANHGELMIQLSEKLSQLNPEQYLTGVTEFLRTLFQSAS
jgi:hypothetical protein